MEMRSDGTCSILNDDCPENKITDCRDCQLHCVFEDYRNRTYRMQEERRIVNITENEAINALKADAEYLVDHNVCDAEEIQIAVNAFEELKQYRAIGTPDECKNIVIKITEAYNKAIDDYLEKLIRNADTLSGGRESSKNYLILHFEEFAKQLKEGASSD